MLCLSSIYFDTETNTEAFDAAGDVQPGAGQSSHFSFSRRSVGASFNHAYMRVFILNEELFLAGSLR